MEAEDREKSWWFSIPGVLTAVAGVITAVAGLIVALHQAGIINNQPNISARTFQKAEMTILRGEPLYQADINTLSKYELMILRNTIYARHGRKFDTLELQKHFNGHQWYKANSNYTNDDLTIIDKANISLIKKIEQ